MNEKISICLATYNGSKYIKEQIDSILCQIREYDEIIISDDQSTDKTLDIIKSYDDNRIKIYQNKLDKGFTRNFENALNLATGDFIFLCDQDDVWEGNKVSVMLDKLKKNDLVVSDATICDSDLNVTLGSHFKAYGTKSGFLNNWIKTRYIGACMAFRKDFLKAVLPLPNNSKLCAHDYWITTLGELFFKVELIRNPLIKYRRHSNNASNGGSKSTNTLAHKITVRIYVLFHLIFRGFKIMFSNF